jgi:uncharacterized protein
MSHQGSLLILPSGMRRWRPLFTAEITIVDCEALLAEKSAIDFLLVGCGPSMDRLPPGISAHLTSHAMRFDIMSTSAAIHTYNIVLAEGRRVAAAMIAVEEAHGRRSLP